MPAPLKQKLSSFSHDTKAREKRNLKLFTANTGLPGLGFWWSLLEEIYNNGYYLPWSSEDSILFANRFSCKYHGVSRNDIDFFLMNALDWDLLDEQMFEAHSVLTSPDIQRYYLKECSRRQLVDIIDEYTLIDLKTFYEAELKSARLSVKVVDLDGDLLTMHGDYKQAEKTTEPAAKPPEKTYDEKYDFSCTDKWDGDQPIDYAGCVDTWNKISGGQARITKAKREDLRRVFRTYIGKECMNAMIVRAKDENMTGSKYLTQWSTLFGAKKLENLDKWVDRGREWLEGQAKLSSVSDHLEAGWVQQREYQNICDAAGIEFEDPTFCEVKQVDGQMLYYPGFDY